MNKLIGLVVFLAGGAVGFFAAKKLLESKYSEIAQEEIDSMKELYERKTKVTNDLAKEFDSMIAAEEKKSTKNPDMSLTRDNVETNTNSYVRSKTAYHDITKEKMKEELGIRGNDEVSDMYHISEMDEEGTYEIDRSKPYVITDEEFSEEFNGHDKVSLYYYMLDGTLCEENEEIIDDIPGTAGYECLSEIKAGDIVWVRNERLGIDYEICTIKGGYPYVDSDDIIGPGLTPRERYEKKMKRKSEDDEE